MKYNQLLVISLAGTAGYYLFWNFMQMLLSDVSDILTRIVLLMGGSPLGIIQATCFGISLYCVIDLSRHRKKIKTQFKGFEFKVLPGEETVMITPQQVNKIKLDILYLERQGLVYEVNEFIRKACTQYKNDNSVGETLHVLDNHIQNKKEIKESELENIRYGVNANMSFGFIGTLIGLATAIGKSELAVTSEGLTELTGYLNIAFDTTLIALSFSLIVNFIYHQYIRELDNFYASANTYIVDNLISKIHRQS
jgi:hypothetical protein